mmetsp:Transcript_34587/g.87275  ORF Transcript_34587/g.87275 Transcript_34587/m.87275 type:complete len:599 (+) Transcript_34587:47-1843(+)
MALLSRGSEPSDSSEAERQCPANRRLQHLPRGSPRQSPAGAGGAPSLRRRCSTACRAPSPLAPLVVLHLLVVPPAGRLGRGLGGAPAGAAPARGGGLGVELAAAGGRGAPAVPAVVAAAAVKAAEVGALVARVGAALLGQGRRHGRRAAVVARHAAAAPAAIAKAVAAKVAAVRAVAPHLVRHVVAAAAAAAAIGRARAPVGEVQVHTLVLGHGLHKAGASVVKALEGVPALGAQVLARLREVAGGAFQLPAQLAALQRLRAAGGHVGGGGDGGAGDAGEAREAARKELRHIVHLGLGLGRHGGRAKAHVLAALAGGDVVPLVGVLRNLPGEKVLLLGSGRLQLRPGVLALPPKPGAVAHAARLGAALLHRAAIAPVVPVVAAEAGQAAVARRHGLAARLGRGRPAGGGLGGRRRVVHPAARLGAQLLPVKLGSLGVVLVRDLRLLGQAVLAEKVVHALVAAELHLLQLVRVPGVHANRPDKADVHAEAAVLAAALQAHEGAIADGRPLGVLGGAVHAHLVVGAFLNLTQDSQRFGGRHGAPVMRRENRRAARFEYQAPLLGDSEREPKGWTTCEARCAGWEVLLRAQGVGAIKSQET